MSNLAVLCVDDEIDILNALKRQFKQLFGTQYIYEIAQSAEEAWEIIAEFEEEHLELTIIISDWLMPHTRGDEFLTQVHLKFPDVIKIMLTGQVEEAAVKNARENANLFACMHKPWSPEELKDVIQAASQR